MLSSLTSKGSDWPYILIQLYEGANHMPLPEDRHICILPQEKAESPSGQISQLKICQLLSTRPSVVFPIELNGGDQSVTMSICPNHCTLAPVSPVMSILTLRSTSLCLFWRSRTMQVYPPARKHDTPAITQPKTPWKPRVTHMVEVNNLIDRGMTDNYDQESEHSIMVEVPIHREADASPPSEDRNASSIIRCLLSGKCCRDGGLYGKQPHWHFAYSSSS